MSPFFLNCPDTTDRLFASTSRQSLPPLLQTYHCHRRGTQASSPSSSSSSSSSADGELSANPAPEAQPPAALPPKTAPSRFEIMFDLSTPTPDGSLPAIPKERSGAGMKAALKAEGKGRVEEG